MTPDPLAPFRRVAAGIPDNWPGDAVLTIEPDDEGRPLMFLCYVPAGWAPCWPTVADWRALAAEKTQNAPAQAGAVATSMEPVVGRSDHV